MYNLPPATTAPLRPKTKKPRASHAGMLLGGIGFVANITAIAGLITSHADVIVITAAVLAILSGLYLLLKRWGKPTGWFTIGAVAMLVAGSVGLALALQTRAGNSDTNTTSNDANTAQTATSGTGDGTPVKKNSAHKVVFEKEFKLTGNEGLELDDEKGSIVVQQSSAKAPIDLFMSSYPTFYVSIKHFFAYQAPDQPTGKVDTDQFNACSNLIENSQLGYNNMSPTDVTPGKQFCVTTTKGRVALVTMNEMVDAGYNSNKNNVTFSVKLWD